MIAWDGEGMKLSGDDAPQHYVLFGCSADPHNPLIGTRLTFRAIADYALSIADKHPGAFHVGYYFSYDQNMIVHSLPWRTKERLYDTGRASFLVDGFRYRIAYVPGKKIRITRTTKAGHHKSTILIEDIAAFWAQSFVGAYKATFPDAESDPTFQRVVAGKALRASMMWEDMPTVRDYWFHEIAAFEKLATRLKDMMTHAGFPLTQWYGPGAFANEMRRKYKLVEHEWGGKETNLPPVVHMAIKAAYHGGHFEPYMVGRMPGPIFAYDLNSAYPAAFLTVPTMQEGGRWEQIPQCDLLEDAKCPAQTLSVYHVQFCTRKPKDALGTTFPMPLPHRDAYGNTTYPMMTHGWYWGPEVTPVVNNSYFGKMTTVTDGWRWIPATDELPWREVIEPMFKKRQALKRAGDPAQMVFKLGPNSLYGKMAQRVGFNTETMEPPRSHTLCIAGYITAWCRGMILRMTHSMWPNEIIAVETDGVYCTVPPERIAEQWPEFRVSKELGEWEMTVYNEIIYVQSGVYLTRAGDMWLPAKTRGFPAGMLTESLAAQYLNTCVAGEKWEKLDLDVGETFIGLGAAINRSRTATRQINPYKATNLHCRWFPERKQIDAQGSGKRQHHSEMCPQCTRGTSPNEEMHRLVVHSKALCNPESVPYQLPWEKGYVEEPWRALEASELDTIHAEPGA